jgi:hypothetical protein
MRWCRSQKPAKSAASIFPVAAGCHPARAVSITPPPGFGFIQNRCGVALTPRIARTVYLIRIVIFFDTSGGTNG